MVKFKQMVKGIVIGIAVCVVTSGITSCAKTAFGFTENNHWNLFSLRFTDRITDFVDDETGVHYLVVFDDESMNAICPRYNKDGSIMVDKEK